MGKSTGLYNWVSGLYNCFDGVSVLAGQTNYTVHLDNFSMSVTSVTVNKATLGHDMIIGHFDT